MTSGCTGGYDVRGYVRVTSAGTGGLRLQVREGYVSGTGAYGISGYGEVVTDIRDYRRVMSEGMGR